MQIDINSEQIIASLSEDVSRQWFEWELAGRVSGVDTVSELELLSGLLSGFNEVSQSAVLPLSLALQTLKHQHSLEIEHCFYVCVARPFVLCKALFHNTSSNPFSRMFIVLTFSCK